ncbi:competence protein CoiA family protein [uncultured Vagococcus sp.]|uniref:competence protein CoiA n=1 Tax=uncultured Vagococcus sp. TaxID=189676 RepID=UPI0028D17E2F|nr:competence protein CoiA family protein [uncultured Vagococcus sp.]
MFIAMNQDGELINLLFKTKEEIRELTRQKWWCSSCGLALTIKNGSIKQSHFAHQKNNACQRVTEGETEEHLKGKRLLAQWCDTFNLTYQLEAYLPELKQRPDVLLGRIAIEFQCSQLPLARLVERTETYQRHGYQVIWVLGKQFFVENRLTAFQRACLNYHQKIGFYLWELDVELEALSCVLHVEEVTGERRVYYSRKSWQVESDSLLKILHFPQENQLFIRRQFKERSILLAYFEKIEEWLCRRDRQTLLIQEQLYQQGVHLRGLDVCFFLPVTHPIVMRGSVFIWRLLVWTIIETTGKGTFSTIFQTFYAQVIQGELELYEMPMISLETNLNLFLTDYLRALYQLGYVTFKEGYFFVRQRPKVFKDNRERELAVTKSLASYNHISVTPRKNMLS